MHVGCVGLTSLGTHIRGVDFDISRILSQDLIVVDVRFEEQGLSSEGQHRNLVK